MYTLVSAETQKAENLQVRLRKTHFEIHAELGKLQSKETEPGSEVDPQTLLR